jgi:hypothetical protein
MLGTMTITQREGQALMARVVKHRIKETYGDANKIEELAPNTQSERARLGTLQTRLSFGRASFFATRSRSRRLRPASPSGPKRSSRLTRSSGPLSFLHGRPSQSVRSKRSWKFARSWLRQRARCLGSADTLTNWRQQRRRRTELAGRSPEGSPASSVLGNIHRVHRSIGSLAGLHGQERKRRNEPAHRQRSVTVTELLAPTPAVSLRGSRRTGEGL